MAQADVFRESLDCLDLLKDPVAVPCGHIFCMRCLQQHWENHAVFSGPQYENTFTPRPDLKKNTVLSALVEELKNYGFQDDPADHGEVMKMLCRTDQQCICSLCWLDDHIGHDTVSVAAERQRVNRQKELEVNRQEVQQRIEDGEKNAKVLEKEVMTINVSAHKAVEYSEKIFTDLIRVLEKRCQKHSCQ
ncbi:unnamed protein product [Lampetra planeri]